MGFCRRCGDIVSTNAARCKCGGAPVAPSVPWSRTNTVSDDKWMKTYVSHMDDDASSTNQQLNNDSEIRCSPSKVNRRFPRPLSSLGVHKLDDNRIAGHIASTTRARTPSPVKSRLETVTESPPAGVLKSPDNATLAKAYGSILQPPETLPIHTCTICSTVFPPDATVYPDIVSNESMQFLCRDCFSKNGGSKGDCATCGRDVLTAVKEGAFIENSGKVWHRRCFRCENCNKDVGNMPMVDLYGKPSCTECFDSCVKRKGAPTKKVVEPTNNIGGMKGKSREGSPALEELSERLGIAQNRLRVQSLSSPSQKLEDEEDNQLANVIKSRRMMGSPITPTRTRGQTTEESTLTTEPSCTESESKRRKDTTHLKIVTRHDTACRGCSLPLLDDGRDDQIVTIPKGDLGDAVDTYHASCFRCIACDHLFENNGYGQATFVRDGRGVMHPECSTDPVDFRARSPTCKPLALGDMTNQFPKSAPPILREFPRFGCRDVCPGCQKTVSPMEPGVVPGPQSTRWHTNCLVCGGKGARLPRPGCGKKLDSAAKTDTNGSVWCRECMLLIPREMAGSSQMSPTHRLVTSFTGMGQTRTTNPESRIFMQMSDTGRSLTTLSRQYTGGTTGLLRSGSISPTRRSASPSKELMGITRHSRPAGSWRNKSVDEGRGMFLVRQMTGNV